MSRFQAQTNAILDEEPADHQGAGSRHAMGSIDLTDAEAERLAEILDRGFSPTPALRKALSRLADPKRQPPRLQWKETAT